MFQYFFSSYIEKEYRKAETSEVKYYGSKSKDIEAWTWAEVIRTHFASIIICPSSCTTWLIRCGRLEKTKRQWIHNIKLSNCKNIVIIYYNHKNCWKNKFEGGEDKEFHFRWNFVKPSKHPHEIVKWINCRCNLSSLAIDAL